MDLIWDGLREAARLWVSGDAEVIEITLRTLAISSAATALALLLGVPLGAALALRRFHGRGLIVAAVNTGMGMPPVVVGLVIVLFLWRSGPLGSLNLIYTPYAMVIAQLGLALPLVVGFSLTSIQALPTKLLDQMRALGANRVQLLWLMMRESRLGILAAVMAGFGAAISEVGRVDAGRRQSRRRHPRADHRDGAGDQSRQLRGGPGAGLRAGRDGLPRQSGADRCAAAPAELRRAMAPSTRRGACGDSRPRR